MANKTSNYNVKTTFTAKDKNLLKTYNSIDKKLKSMQTAAKFTTAAFGVVGGGFVAKNIIDQADLVDRAISNINPEAMFNKDIKTKMFDTIQDSIMNMTMSLEDSINLFEELSRAGFSSFDGINTIAVETSKLLDVMGSKNKGEDAKTMIEIIGSMLGQRKDDPEEVKKLMSNIAAASKTGTFTATDLIYAMKHSATSAREGGMTQEEYLGLLSQMSTIGVKGETAGTMVKTLVNSLQQASKDKDLMLNLNQLGLNLNKTEAQKVDLESQDLRQEIETVLIKGDFKGGDNFIKEIQEKLKDVDLTTDELLEIGVQVNQESILKKGEFVNGIEAQERIFNLLQDKNYSSTEKSQLIELIFGSTGMDSFKDYLGTDPQLLKANTKAIKDFTETGQMEDFSDYYKQQLGTQIDILKTRFSQIGLNIFKEGGMVNSSLKGVVGSLNTLLESALSDSSISNLMDEIQKDLSELFNAFEIEDDQMLVQVYQVLKDVFSTLGDIFSAIKALADFFIGTADLVDKAVIQPATTLITDPLQFFEDALINDPIFYAKKIKGALFGNKEEEITNEITNTDEQNIIKNLNKEEISNQLSNVDQSITNTNNTESIVQEKIEQIDYTNGINQLIQNTTQRSMTPNLMDTGKI